MPSSSLLNSQTDVFSVPLAIDGVVFVLDDFCALRTEKVTCLLCLW